jgi:hypothetical protein
LDYTLPNESSNQFLRDHWIAIKGTSLTGVKPGQVELLTAQDVFLSLTCPGFGSQRKIPAMKTYTRDKR